MIFTSIRLEYNYFYSSILPSVYSFFFFFFFPLSFTCRNRLPLYRPRKGTKPLSTCNYTIWCLCGTKFVIMEVVFFLVPLHVSLTSPQVVLVRPYKIWGLVLVLLWQMRKLQSHPTACSITPFSLFADTHTCTIYCPLTRMGLKRTRQCRSIT